ncbi:MAG: ATP-binding cassette domain-containing protein [Saprospiraceae bacterium]
MGSLLHGFIAPSFRIRNGKLCNSEPASSRTHILTLIEKGNVYGVVGPNGAGKSTLFKAILGLIDVNAGKVVINGESIKEQRKNVVYVPQKDDDW